MARTLPAWVVCAFSLWQCNVCDIVNKEDFLLLLKTMCPRTGCLLFGAASLQKNKPLFTGIDGVTKLMLLTKCLYLSEKTILICTIDSDVHSVPQCVYRHCSDGEVYMLPLQVQISMLGFICVRYIDPLYQLVVQTQEMTRTGPHYLYYGVAILIFPI